LTKIIIIMTIATTMTPLAMTITRTVTTTTMITATTAIMMITTITKNSFLDKDLDKEITRDELRKAMFSTRSNMRKII